MTDGWSSWGAVREHRVDPEINQPGDAIRYCPRCDNRTVWSTVGDGVRSCTCGVTLTTILTDDELDRIRKHYAGTL